MVNEWLTYYATREEYFGKHGANADRLISLLGIISSDFVLDVGCGPGAYLDDIKKKKHTFCVGLDLSFDAIRKRHTWDNFLVVADMHYLPFKANSFTKLFSLGTVEHTPNTKKVLAEVARMLKTGGKACLTVPNKISFFHITKNIKMLLGSWDLGYEKSFTSKQFTKLLRQAALVKKFQFITPHPRVTNIFNFADNILNKLANHLFGFFLCVIAEKVV